MSTNAERIKQVLSRVSAYPMPERLDPQDDLFDQGLLDSITIVQFVVALEEEFHFHFNFSDLTRANFFSLASIQSYLEKILAASESS